MNVCVLPVTHTKVRVGHLCNHEPAAFCVATRKAKLAVGSEVLLYNQQHGRRLQRQQLAQVTNGQTLLLRFILNTQKHRLYKEDSAILV